MRPDSIVPDLVKIPCISLKRNCESIDTPAANLALFEMSSSHSIGILFISWSISSRVFIALMTLNYCLQVNLFFCRMDY